MLRQLDTFGPTISLNFKGDEQFQTLRGGLLTIVVYVFSIWQLIAIVTQLVTQEEPTVASYRIYETADKSVLLSEHNQAVQIHFRGPLSGEVKNAQLDPRAGNL